jgi:hypothetical protein
LGAAGFIFEEKFMNNSSSLYPMEIVGCEGISASFMWIIVLTAFQFIHCSDETFCSNNHIEDTYGAWQDYASNSLLVWESLAIFLIIPFSSFCGVTTTKRGSAS